MCPSVGGCALLKEGVPSLGEVSQCGRVCPNVGGYAPVREGISQYVWGVSQCERLCTIVGGHAHVYMICVCEVWVCS